MVFSNNTEYYILRYGKRVMINSSLDNPKIFILKELDEKFQYFDNNIEICFLENYKNTILHYWPEIITFISNNKNSKNPNIFKNNNISLYYLYENTLQNIFCIYPNIFLEIIDPIIINWKQSNYTLNDIVNYINNKLYIKYIYDYLVKSIKIHPDYYTDSQLGFVIYNKVYFKFLKYRIGNILEI